MWGTTRHVAHVVCKHVISIYVPRVGHDPVYL